MATNKTQQGKNTVPILRMDQLKDTIESYTSELQEMTQGIEEMERRLVKLQKNLEVKKERNKSLRAQVEALRVKDQELKNQDKLGVERIDELNARLRDAEARLAAVRAEGEDLRRQIVEKVNVFESSSHDMAMKFQSLQLNREGDGNEVTSEEVAVAQEEVDVLKAEIESLTNPKSEPLPLTPIKNLIEEIRTCLDAQRTLNQELAVKEACLKKELSALREAKASKAVEI